MTIGELIDDLMCYDATLEIKVSRKQFNIEKIIKGSSVFDKNNITIILENENERF